MAGSGTPQEAAGTSGAEAPALSRTPARRAGRVVKDPLGRGGPATVERLIRCGRDALSVLEEVERVEAQASAAAGRNGRSSRRPVAEPAFLLHAHPWSESSLVIDALTARFGRVFLIARGAKRPGSNLRGILLPFTPLRLSWTGRGEAKVLTHAEWLGVLPPLEGDALLSGFYVNELVLRLTAREDPHPGLFTSYVRVMEALCCGSGTLRQRGLRRFEAELLAFCGWGVAIDEAEASPGAVRASDDLWRLSGTGALVPAGHPDAGTGKIWSGPAVREVLAGRLEGPEALRTAREIYREAVELRLEGRPLRSRRVLAELKRL